MAHEGELVRMGNGRWARYERLPICQPGQGEGPVGSLLVAVELDDEAQERLRAMDRVSTRDAGQADRSRRGFRAPVSGAALH